MISILHARRFSGMYITILLSFSFAFAQSSPSLIDLVRKNYSCSTSLQTKFSLSLFWRVREKTDQKQGSISIAPANRFRLSLGAETYVCDGESFWEYNASSRQVVIKKISDVDRSSLPSRVFTDYIASTSRRFLEKERKNGVAKLEWNSDSAPAAYTRIEVWVSEKSGIITKCKLTDRNMNISTYVFSKTILNSPLTKETYNFVIPNGTRIVDMRS